MKILNIPKVQIQPQIARHEQRRECCFYAYPVMVCYDIERKTPIPLQNVNYNLKILKGMVCVEIEQTYSTMNQNNPIDLEYLFAINKNAAVTKMLIELGEKKVIGIIKEKEEAQQQYEEGIKQGKTMAYCDQDQKFPEIKRIKLGQLEPQKVLKITFEYIQPLDIVFNRFWKVQISPLIDENYVNQKGNEVLFRYLLDYVQLRNLKYTYRQDFKITIDTGSNITFVKSPTHSFVIDAVKQQLYCPKIELNLDENPNNYLPNKQFTLLFSTEDINMPSAILSHTSNDALQYQKYCATLTFVPKFNELPLDDAYSQYLDKLNFNQNQKINRGNYIFIIDRSGSMSGQRIEKAKESLILFLKSLPEDSQFNIISFGSNHTQLWNNQKLYNQESLDEAVQYVTSMRADFGGTEIRKTLQNVVYTNNYGQLKNQTLNVFLLTDGGDDPQPIIDLVQVNNKPETRVYTIGIGEGCNQYLIKRIAEVGNGKCQFVKDNEDINEKVIDLLEDSITSYLEQFTLDCNIHNISTIIPNPESVISLKKNQLFTVQILFSDEGQQENLQFQIGCFDPQEQKQIKYSVDLNIKDSIENEYFHKLAIHKYITVYQDAIRNGNQQLNIKDIKEQINDSDLVNISIEHQILCPKTAFICEVCDVEDQFKQQKRQKIIINKQSEINHHFILENQQILCCQAAPVQRLQQNKCFAPQFQAMQSAMSPPQDQIFFKYERPNSNIGMPLFCSAPKVKCMPLNSPQCLSMAPPPPPGMNAMQSEFKMSCLSFQEREKAKSPQKLQAKKMSHIEIMQFSQADGSFKFPISSAINLLSDQIENKHNLTQNIWYTILALFYLEIKFNEQKATWQLIYSKGVQFLHKNGINYQDVKKQYIDQYRQVLDKGE